MQSKKPFLTAQWKKLAIANYAVDPKLLNRYVPGGLELDYFNGKCYVSLVAFMFLNTRLKSIAIPFHQNFEEVNLRFYVRRKEGIEWRRGVTFISEFVPKPVIAFVANSIYGEKYRWMTMKHKWNVAANSIEVDYRWKLGSWNSFCVSGANKKIPIGENSAEEFITEHYWGYTQLSRGRTSQYGVLHPRWMVYPIKEYKIDVDFGKLYGQAFAALSNQVPDSIMLAEGSEIAVNAGTTDYFNIQ